MAIPENEKHTAEEYFALTPEDNSNRFELIDGEFVALAAPNQLHQELVFGICRELYDYIKRNKGGCKPMISPFDVWIDDNNVVQPDVLVVCDPNKLDGKRCNGAPDLVVEVLSGNRNVDIYWKTGVYSSAGVREYWIVDPLNEKVIVYHFEKTDIPELFTFNSDIPVRIFDEKLSINIAELIE